MTTVSRDELTSEDIAIVCQRPTKSDRPLATVGRFADLPFIPGLPTVELRSRRCTGTTSTQEMLPAYGLCRRMASVEVLEIRYV